MNDKKLPRPFYAAAGAGEVGVEQLKKLSVKVGELRDRAKLTERAEEVRDNVKQGVDTVRHLDREQLRDMADNAATTIGGKARVAADTARDTYADLVRRGEHVANGERSPIKVIATVASGQSGEDKPAESGETAEKTEDTAAAARPAKKAAKKTAKKSTAKKTTTAK